MPSVQLPNGIRVALEFNIQDKVVVNIYHVTTTDPIVTVKLLQVAQMFADWFTADLAYYLSHDIGLFNVVATDISVEGGEQQVLPISPEEQGVITAPAMPNNVAYVVSHSTARTGRSYMGRTYLAGIAIQDVTDNQIDSGRAANIVTVYNSLISGLVTIDSELVVASFVANGEFRPYGIGTPVDGIAMNLRVDTQRRRLPR